MGADIMHLECACETLTHSIRFRYDPEYSTFEVTTHLGDWLPWYRRIWLAVKYVLRITHGNNYQYDCTMLKPSDIGRLRWLLGRVDGTSCVVAPHGWYCSRIPGHEGPCAAHKCQ